MVDTSLDRIIPQMCDSKKPLKNQKSRCFSIPVMADDDVNYVTIIVSSPLLVHYTLFTKFAQIHNETLFFKC